MPSLNESLWDLARERATSAGFAIAGGCESHLRDLVDRLAGDVGDDEDRIALAQSYVRMLIAAMVDIAKARGMDALHEPTFFEGVARVGDPIARTQPFRIGGTRRSVVGREQIDGLKGCIKARHGVFDADDAPPAPPAPAAGTHLHPPGWTSAKPPERPQADAAPARDAEPATADPPRSAFAVLDCPPVVAAAVEFEIRIGLAAEQSPGVVGGPLVRPPSSVGAYTLAVQVVADGFALRDGETWRNVLSVTADAPYPTFVVHLTPKQQAEAVRPGVVQAIYSVDGHTMGFAVRPVAVVKQHGVHPPDAPPAGATGVDLTVPTQQIAADLTVRISTDARETGGLLWTFETPFADVSVPDEPIKTNIGDRPQAFAQQLVAKVNRKEGQPDLPVFLRGIGKTIANQIPDEFWTALHAVAGRSGGSPTVLLLSQEAYVPWELALVPDPLFDRDAPPFLSAQVTVGRWVLSKGTKLPPPASHDVEKMAVVSGEYKGPRFQRLLEAEREAADITGRYPYAVSVNADVPNVLACLQGTVEADLLHFAVHGMYDPDGVEEGLALVDGRFLDPMAVTGSTLARAPFVFLNACQVGSGSEILGDYAGMAAAFLAAGASGVIAPLWSIKDNIAHQVALDFYRTVSDGERPAAALRRARRDFSAPSPSPSGTTLAYQFFGHPALHLQMRKP